MAILIHACRKLDRAKHVAANLSVFHIQAYLLGVETGKLLLNIKDQDDIHFITRFQERVFQEFGGNITEYDSIWRASVSVFESTILFLSEWQRMAETLVENETWDSFECSAKVMDLSNLLKNVQKNPHLFLRSAGITHFKAFCDGIQFTANFLGNVSVSPNFNEFEAQLRKRIAPNSKCSWDMLLISMSGGDEIGAFERVFDELQEFQEANSSSV